VRFLQRCAFVDFRPSPQPDMFGAGFRFSNGAWDQVRQWWRNEVRCHRPVWHTTCQNDDQDRWRSHQVWKVETCQLDVRESYPSPISLSFTPIVNWWTLPEFTPQEIWSPISSSWSRIVLMNGRVCGLQSKLSSVRCLTSEQESLKYPDI
jgi:hypothetical protein